MNYVVICFLVDHYELLVDLARTPEEREFRMEQLLYWKSQLIKMQN